VQLRLGAPDRRKITRGMTPLEPTRRVLKQMVLRCYAEMPGLLLTPAQLARMLNVRVAASEAVLRDMVGDGRLRRDLQGQYMPPGCAWSDGTRG
jgi:hypothetical protein